MTFHPRTDWTGEYNGCADRFDRPAVRGVAIHWVGSGLSDDLRRGVDSDVAAFLRSCRARNKADGYCDIEYNLAVAGDGDIWACRGLEMDGGANGTTAANDVYVSILVIYPVGGRPTDAQIQGVKKAIRMVRDKYPNAKQIRPHQFFVPTQCPGPAALELIRRGGFEPGDGSGDRKLIEQLRDAIADIGHRRRKVVRRIAELVRRRKRLDAQRERKHDRIDKIREN